MCCSWKSAPSPLFLPPSYLSHSRVFQKKGGKIHFALSPWISLVTVLFGGIRNLCHTSRFMIKMDFQSSKQYIFLITTSSVKYQLQGFDSFYYHCYYFDLIRPLQSWESASSAEGSTSPQPYLDPINLSREGGATFIQKLILGRAEIVDITLWNKPFWWECCGLQARIMYYEGWIRNCIFSPLCQCSPICSAVH